MNDERRPAPDAPGSDPGETPPGGVERRPDDTPGGGGGEGRRWRHVRTIARTELLRTRRGLGGDRRTRLFGAGVALLLGVGLVVTTGEVHRVGVAVRAGTDVGLLELARSTVLRAALLLTVLFAFRTAASLGRPANVELLATTVSPRTVAGGLLAAEYVRNAAVFGALAAIHGLALGLGLGRPVVAAAATAATMLMLAVTLLAGYVLGLGLRLLAGRTAADLRIAILGLVALAVLAVGSVAGGTGRTGIGLYGDLFLAGSQVVPAVRSGSWLVALGAAAAVPALLSVALRLAPMLWFADTGGEQGAAPVLSGRHPRLGGGPTGRAAWTYWLRAIRAPVRLSHGVYLVLLLAPPAMVALVLPRLAAALAPGMAAFAGVWIAGATFNLNPVHDEGDALPIVVLAEVGPSVFVRARVLAGLIPGLAVVAFAAVTPLVVGARPAAAGLSVAIGAALAVAGSAVGAGLGYLAVASDLGSGPREEVPNPFVVVIYTFLALVATGTALLGAHDPGLLADLLPMLPVGGAMATVAVLALALLLGGLSYRYAVTRLASYTPH